MNVATVNDPPVAVADAYGTEEDSSLTVSAPGVLANDTDVDGGTLPMSAALVAGPDHGALTLNSDGSFSYQAAQDYSGAESFTYKVVDPNRAESSIVTMTINVAPVDDPPVIVGPRDVKGNILRSEKLSVA